MPLRVLCENNYVPYVVKPDIFVIQSNPYPMTPNHNQETGLAGEALATRHLEQLGYRIAARNWRAGRGELDIVAWSPENVLVFVEVKTRALDGFGGPAEAVDRKKEDQIARTAGAYMESIDYEAEIRFDIISILLRGGRMVSLKHMEDAFFPGL